MIVRLLPDTAPPLPEHGEPPLAICDTCGHRHRCFVGGEPPAAGAAASAWGRTVCLGCIVRAGRGDPAVKHRAAESGERRAA